MLIGVGFLGEEEMLVIREENLVIRSKVAQKRGRLSIFVLMMYMRFGLNEYQHLIKEDLVNEE